MHTGGHADSTGPDDSADTARLRFVERHLRVELPAADARQIQAAAEAFIAGLEDELTRQPDTR